MDEKKRHWDKPKGDLMSNHESNQTKGVVPTQTANQGKSVQPTPKKSSAFTKDVNFPVVGLGASAGGLEALQKFLSRMHPDSGLGIVVVTHMEPSHISRLPELLQRESQLPVVQATDGLVVLPDHVYVIPPNKTISISARKLQVLEQTDRPGIGHAVDFFLKSLAQDLGPQAIGIILSGTGSDGTQGLKAIKTELGITMAQDPKTARYPGMPESAIGTGLVDLVLAPEEMPEQIQKLVKGLGKKRALITRTPVSKSREYLPRIYSLIRQKTGHDFSGYKETTIQRRIARRMGIHQIEKFTDYLRFLQENPQEIESLFKDILINVTSFFRDPEAFDFLKETMKAQIASRSEEKSIRIWVAGGSTGEEAYSIAIVVRECLEELQQNNMVQIFATDIDEAAIDVGRTAFFPASVENDVTPERLKKYFIKIDNGYRINKEIRQMVVYARHDLIRDPPFSRMDLISCRNFLIYLNSGTQKKLLPILHYALAPKGILFLGSSESIGENNELFSTLSHKWKIYQRREANAQDLPVLPRLAAPFRSRSTSSKLKSANANIPDVDITAVAARLLEEDYLPPAVLIDNRNQIVHFYGQTGKFLEPATGQPAWDILEMAREGLKLKLASAIRYAASQKKAITYQNIQVKFNKDNQTIDLTVKPVLKPGVPEGMLMVIFQEASDSGLKGSLKTEEKDSRPGDERTTELEETLKLTKENLQGTIEELETSNEELQTAVEEYQSTNEELQSTNEELETSREELESMNEELVTVNSEHQEKIEELSRTNDDIKNLLNSTDIATVFLDKELRIKRFTMPANRIFPLIDGDVGRPITDFTSQIVNENIETALRQVLKTLVLQEREVQTRDGTWYLLRILPYRTTENAATGLTLTLVDVSRQRELAGLKLALEYTQSIFSTLRDPILILDADLKIISANRSFYQFFGVTPQETENHLVYELGNKQWDIPQLRKLLEKILPESVTIENYPVEHDFPTIGHRKMLLNARRIYNEKVKIERILLAMEDVSDHDG